MKNTNRLFFALLAAAALLFAAGCSQDTSDSDDEFAGTTWTYSYPAADDGDIYYALTLKFESGGKVTMYDDTYENGTLVESDPYSGTYTVSGSTVTVDLGSSGTLQLAYSSGQLVAGATFTAVGSLDLGDTITASNLEGTTWQASYAEETFTIKFESGGKVTLDNMRTVRTGTYSVSGSTVTIIVSAYSEVMELAYSSGKLEYVSMIFTKS